MQNTVIHNFSNCITRGIPQEILRIESYHQRQHSKVKEEKTSAKLSYLS